MVDTLQASSSTTAADNFAELRPPRHRVEKRAILLWTMHAVTGAVIFIGGTAIAYAFLDSWRPYLGPLMIILAAVYAANIAFMPTWRYLVHRWEISDQAVYALTGWVEREWRITPISRIQSINTVKGPMQQLLGLATLKVTTAAREGSISIAGLDATVAEEAARRLTEITELTPGDAT